MTLHRPLFMQAAGGDTAPEYSAQNTRLLVSALVKSEGVFSGLAVSQRAAGANFSVDVGTGHAAVQGDDVSGQFKYVVYSDATENVTVPAAPVSGTRIHRVVAQVEDYLHNGALAANTYQWRPLLLEDTGSGTPAVPATAISLATVSVAAGQVSVTDSNITDTREFAAFWPGSWPATINSASLRPAAPRTAEQVWRSDQTVIDVYDGSSWQQILTSAGGPAWASYTPSLTASTTNPTLGTGSSRIGSWTRIGRTVHVTAAVVFGTSGANAGGGTYRVSLPVTAKTLTAGYHLGSSQVYDLSDNNADAGVSRIGGSAGWSVMEFIAAGNLATHNVPWAWANGDAIYLSITYEAAS